MNTSLLIKVFLVLPLIVFVDYTLMALIGCTTCLLGFGNDFYCGEFCIFGKIILAVSAILFGFIIYPDIALLFKANKNGATAEK